jgi:biotin carboxyl carrier protein
MTSYELDGPDGPLKVEVERVAEGFQVKVAGKAFTLKLDKGEGSSLIAQLGDRPIPISLEEATGNRVTLLIGGERLTFEKPLSVLSATQVTIPTRVGPKNELISPMPGRVVAVSVDGGQAVKEGDPLVMIESMKMESVIRSDRDGKISEVLVEEGATVKRGQALVRFATAGPS